METKPINPWTWQEPHGFSQAVNVTGAQQMIFCAGQTSVDDNGNPLHAGDMLAQINRALDNLGEVLELAGLDWPNVVRLNYYVTDINAFMQAGEALAARLHEAGCKPSSTLLGVAALFHPEIIVEIEATAVC